MYINVSNQQNIYIYNYSAFHTPGSTSFYKVCFGPPFLTIFLFFVVKNRRHCRNKRLQRILFFQSYMLILSGKICFFIIVICHFINSPSHLSNLIAISFIYLHLYRFNILIYRWLTATLEFHHLVISRTRLHSGT